MPIAFVWGRSLRGGLPEHCPTPAAVKEAIYADFYAAGKITGSFRIRPSSGGKTSETFDPPA
ncbi:MAG: hypothetical protein AB8I80_18660, partial [Anaerolineae bacterium]